MPRAKRKFDLRIAAYLGGSLLFGLVLLALGARLEPPTITMVLAAAALGLLLHTLFRMVMALARPAAEADVVGEGALGDITTRELREEKRRVLRAINELQFDYEMGKLSDEDFRSVRELYEARAIEVMRALDQQRTLHPDVLKHLTELDIDPRTVGHQAEGHQAEDHQAEDHQVEEQRV